MSLLHIFSVDGNTKLYHFSGDRICNEPHFTHPHRDCEHGHHLRHGDTDDAGASFLLSLRNQRSHRLEAGLTECRLLCVRLPCIAVIYLIPRFRFSHFRHRHFRSFRHSLHQNSACRQNSDDLCLCCCISCDAAFYIFPFTLLFISLSHSLH